jgi:hypothetical protein
MAMNLQNRLDEQFDSEAREKHTVENYGVFNEANLGYTSGGASRPPKSIPSPLAPSHVTPSHQETNKRRSHMSAILCDLPLIPLISCEEELLGLVQ